jgi:hypothetical protein
MQFNAFLRTEVPYNQATTYMATGVLGSAYEFYKAKKQEYYLDNYVCKPNSMGLLSWIGKKHRKGDVYLNQHVYL